MAIRRSLIVLFSCVCLPAQEWLKYRGPGDLLPPQLGGGAAMADLTTWPFAWEFQRDALQPAQPEPTPLPDALLDTVVPPLLAAARAEDEELAMLSLWALARIAAQHERVATQLRERLLTSGLQRSGPSGEVAALALGLAARGDPAALKALIAVAHDTTAGRALVAAPAVSERLRCFALYGLGLAAERAARAEVQFQVLAAVERLLLPEAGSSTGLRIAALHGLALVRLDEAPTLPGPALRLLEQQWSFEEPASFLSVVSQVPIAATAMLRLDAAATEAWRQRFSDALQVDNMPLAVRRSCAQALGRLCRAADDAKSPDASYSEVLRIAATNNRDVQTQNLALLALGLIGGDANRAWLAGQLTAAGGGAVNIRRPWAGFGLGCGVAWRGQVADQELITLLQGVAQNTRPPSPLGGVAVGLGLCRSPDSAPALLALLQNNLRRDDAAAPLCAALASVGATAAVDVLRQAAETQASPYTVREAMLAYAALGGNAAAAQLRTWLLDPGLDRARRRAAAIALRGRADQDAVTPLLLSLADPQLDIDQRRLAAFALGSLCDRSARHWSAKLAAAIDYRGSPPVLVGAPNGVLRLP